MSRPSWRGQPLQALLAAVLMVASVFVSAALTPTVRLAEQLGPLDLEDAVPREFGGWKVDTLLPAAIVNPQQQAVLGRIYSQTLSRTYVDPQGRRVMLSIAYGEDQRDAMGVHKPEVCYPAQGFQLRSRATAEVPIGEHRLPVTRLETDFADRRFEPVTYWIVLAGEVVPSDSSKKLMEMKYGLNGVIPDGLIFRVSSIDRNSATAYAVQDQFLRDLLASMPPTTRKRLTGI